LEAIVSNPNLICYGRLPQNIIDEYTAYADGLIKKYPSVMNPILESMKKSLTKYNRTRDQASNAGKEAAYDLKPMIHPMIASSVDAKEHMLMDFRETLKNYKPRASTLEIGIMKTKDEKTIGMFREALTE